MADLSAMGLDFTDCNLIGHLLLFHDLLHPLIVSEEPSLPFFLTVLPLST